MIQRTVNLHVNPRRQFSDYLKRTQRWASLVVHRRGGKTFACIQDLGVKGLTHKRKGPPVRYAYIAPTRDQAKDIAWGYVKEFCNDIPGKEFNESELKVTLPTGSSIRLYSGENYDRMRGLYFDGVVIDEPADIDPIAWPSVIRPCLSDYNGWATFIGTPKGRNSFYRTHVHALEHPDSWFSMTLRASESGIIPQEELDEIRLTTPDHIYRQEYECDFSVALQGAIYAGEVDKARAEGRISKDVAYYAGFPVFSAFDIGAPVNQRCVIFQIIGDYINVLEGASGGVERRMPADWVHFLKSKQYRYGGHFLPHDGEVLWLQQMRDAELDNVLVVPKQASVWDGINESLQSFSRTRFKSETTIDLVEALECYHSKEETDGVTISDVPVHDWSSHYSDAFSLMNQAIRHGMTTDRSAIPRRARGINRGRDTTATAKSGIKL